MICKDQALEKTTPTTSELFFFSENKYILEKPEAYDKHRCTLLKDMPTIENIYEFIKALYDCA